ncbi:hypothetical protein HMPREF1868_00513 [Olsenella sp. DNF00959]|nr:hypothetical protein HMPREF1868_00513 [Olsenella sp. DNF00959]
MCRVRERRRAARACDVGHAIIPRARGASLRAHGRARAARPWLRD